jgi:hypothetical protein
MASTVPICETLSLRRKFIPEHDQNTKANKWKWTLRDQGLPRLDQPRRLQQGGAEDGRVEEAGRQAGIPEVVEDRSWAYRWLWIEA